MIVYNTFWHADDVRDFTFRIFSPLNIAITLTSFTTSLDLQLAQNKFDLASSIATQTTYTSTDALGFSYRSGWYGSGNGYQYGIQGATGKDCQISITVTGYGGNTYVDSDVGTSNCSPVVSTTSAG